MTDVLHNAIENAPMNVTTHKSFPLPGLSLAGLYFYWTDGTPSPEGAFSFWISGKASPTENTDDDWIEVTDVTASSNPDGSGAGKAFMMPSGLAAAFGKVKYVPSVNSDATFSADFILDPTK